MRRPTVQPAAALLAVLLSLAVLVGCGAPAGPSAPATPSAALPSAVGAPSPTPTPSPIPGLLLIADRGNNRILLVDNAKQVVWRYPRPGVTPSFPLVFDDDTFFVPGYHGIITNQEGQDTVQIVSFPAGAVVWHYGHPNVAGSSPGYLARPDDSYVLPDGTRTIVDVLNDRVIFVSPAGRIVRQYGTTGVAGHDPPRLLSSPNGATPLPDGGLLITEINGSWVDRISRTGRLVFAVRTPASYPSDAQLLSGGRIMLADYSRPGHVFIIDRHGRVLWRYGPASGPGMLDHPSLALPLPNGLIAVNDDYRHRVVIIDPGTGRIVWQYGHTNVAGRGPGYLNTPDGMDLLPANAVATDPALAGFRPAVRQH